ncbi:MAG: porin family protein [Parvularculaceae bacterium]|nr:porin family protein [Parvularculaceae bacterium]
MKTFAAALVAATMLSTAASAQWTGFYFGGNVGYGWGDSDSDVALSGQWAIEPAALRTGVTNLWSTSQSPDGVNFGAQLGYNHEFSGGFVVGLEADYAALNADDARLLPLTATSFGPTPTYGPGNSVDGKHMLAAKAKLGFSSGSWLFYATGGWSMAQVEGTAEVTSSGGYSKFGADTEWLSGVVYGAGIETMLGSNWSARVEYLRGDYSDFEYATAYRAGSTFVSPAYNEIITQDFDINSVRLAINFHF